jgi:hypothetical protein
MPLFSEIFIEFLKLLMLLTQKPVQMTIQGNVVRIDLVWMRRMRYLERSIISCNK